MGNATQRQQSGAGAADKCRRQTARSWRESGKIKGRVYLVVVGEIAGMKFRWRRGWKTLGKYVDWDNQPTRLSLFSTGSWLFWHGSTTSILTWLQRGRVHARCSYNALCVLKDSFAQLNARPKSGSLNGMEWNTLPRTRTQTQPHSQPSDR